jgi:hypothetical protein
MKQFEFDKYQKYKNKIENIAKDNSYNPKEIFNSLLDEYISNHYIDIGLFENRPNEEFATQLRDNYLDIKSCITEINKFLETTQNFNKNDDFFALLTAYFYKDSNIKMPLNSAPIEIETLQTKLQQFLPTDFTIQEQNRKLNLILSHIKTGKDIKNACKLIGKLVFGLTKEQITSVISTLLERAKDTEWEVQALACEVLGKLPYKTLTEEQITSVISTLFECAKDTEQSVRASAWEAAMTHQIA